MRKDIFDRVCSGILPRINRESISQGVVRSRTDLKRVHSGTTVLAFFYDKGIILAGDRKTSCGFSIVDQDKVKLYQVAPHSACAAAGLVSDIQMLVRDLEQVNGAFFSQYGYLLSIEGQVNYLINQFRYYWQYTFAPLEVSIFLGGLNPKNGSFQLFDIGSDGFQRECLDYVVNGSGSDFAATKLEESRKKILEKKLSKDEAIELALRAIFMAGKKDLGTSDVRVAIPTIATIDNKGFSFMDSEVIGKALSTIIKEET